LLNIGNNVLENVIDNIGRITEIMFIQSESQWPFKARKLLCFGCHMIISDNGA